MYPLRGRGVVASMEKVDPPVTEGDGMRPSEDSLSRRNSRNWYEKVDGVDSIR